MHCKFFSRNSGLKFILVKCLQSRYDFNWNIHTVSLYKYEYQTIFPPLHVLCSAGNGSRTLENRLLALGKVAFGTLWTSTVGRIGKELFWRRQFLKMESIMRIIKKASSTPFVRIPWIRLVCWSIWAAPCLESPARALFQSKQYFRFFPFIHQYSYNQLLTSNWSEYYECMAYSLKKN